MHKFEKNHSGSFLNVRNSREIPFVFTVGMIFVLFFCAEVSAQGSKKPKLKFAPPGTNILHGKLFIDETEVTNQTWRDYMYWMRRVYGDDSPEFRSTLPDTLVWKRCFEEFTFKTKRYWNSIESLVIVYLRYTKFSHYPVVGISFEQAKQFCSWRTNRVNEVYYVEQHRNVTFPIDSSNVIPRKVEFRLPSEEEWEMAAKAGFDTLRSINNNRKLFYHTKETIYTKKVSENYERFIPMRDQALKPDKYNRYHLFGNVAEMIDTKGVAKGGSYIHSMEEGYYTRRINYHRPEYWLGFRCICEVF